MTTDSNIALHLNNISVSYQHKPVLDKLSLTIADNEIMCLLGQSGSGKTTALKSIAGLLPLRNGEITLNGECLSSAKHCVMPEQRGISIIFQDFALFPHMTVLENVCFGIKARAQVANDKASALLALVKMSDYKSVYPSELSGGQQQRVAITRALATDPKVLLLDEPFSNVDHHLKEQLMLDIRKVLKQHHTPAVFVTHSKEEAFAFADKLAFMESGKVIQEGIAESLYFEPNSASLAESMGEGNWLEVSVTEDKLTHCPYLGTMPTAVPDEQQHSSTLHQFIRPNQLILEANPTGNAEIIDQAFNGESRHYFVRLDKIELRVSAVSNTKSLPNGALVDVTVLPHQAILFEST